MKKRVVSLLLCLIMALSLIPTAAFATEGENVEETPVAEAQAEPAGETQAVTGEAVVQKGPWNPSQPVTNKTVDHIDVALGFTIPGTNQKFNLDKTDYANITIAGKQKNGTSTTYKPTKYSSSTDNDGNAQVRLEGIFPVGTQDDPVVYTLTLEKTVSGTKYTLKVEVSYWSANNICPGTFNKTGTQRLQKWTNGEVPMGSGIDVAFGAAGSSEYQVNLTKVISGVDNADLIAGKEFVFTIYDKDNQVVKTETLIAEENATSIYNIITLPKGNYTVKETLHADYSDYNFVSSSDTQNLTVTEKGGSATITNMYSKQPTTGSLTIIKNIEGVTLTEDKTFTFNILKDKQIVDTVDVTVNAYATTGISESVTLSPGTYTVKEVEDSATFKYYYDLTTTYRPLADGTVEIKADESSTVTVTNQYTKLVTLVTVEKKWEHNGVPAALQPTEVEVKLIGKMTAGPDGSDHTFETTTLNADSNWKYVFHPALKYNGNGEEIRYRVEETPVPGYTTEITGSVADGFTITNTAQWGEEQINPASLTIYKFELDKINTPLSGAEFTLTKQGETTGAVKTTDKDGFCTFDNLEVGVYTLTETKAPAGYNSLGNTWTIYVEKDTNTKEIVLDEATGKFVKRYDCMVYEQLNGEEESYLLDYNTLSIPNEKAPEPVTLKNLKVTKNVTKALGSLNPGSADFTFEACYINANNELVKFTNNTLTIHTTGDKTSYTENWALTIPAEAFCHDDDDYSGYYAELVISEVNGKLSGWTYDKEVYTLCVLQNGDIFNGGLPHALTPEKEEVGPTCELTFKNVYDYTYTPRPTPNPKPTPTPKPVQSVKTGDMGIAMYAMTSLLSLGGAALVIKKRKDEE